MNPNDVVNIAFNCFIILCGILFLVCIFYGIIFDIIIDIKTNKKISKIRNKNFEFIEKYKNDNLPTNQYKNRFDWELKHNFKQNYEKIGWCSICKYWVEINDGGPYTFRKGICKIKYKQNHSIGESSTYNDWRCEYCK